MKRMAITFMTALLCFGGSAANMGASAERSYGGSYLPEIGETRDGYLYVGEVSKVMNTMKDCDRGWVYRNPNVKWDFVKSCYVKHVDVRRRLTHVYIKGDDSKFHLPKLNYSPGLVIGYDVKMRPLSTKAGHDCYQDLQNDRWVFSVRQGKEYYCLHYDGSVEKYLGKPIFPF